MLIDEQILNARILIVDDNILNVQILKKILTEAGFYNITPTTDPLKSFDIYQELCPDLVLLDFNMPHFNGLEMMKLYASVDPDGYLPVLMITAETDHALRTKALQSGAKDFIRKPYDRQEVVLRSRNLIEVRLMYNLLKTQNVSLEEKVRDRTKELFKTRLEVIYRLARVAEYRDKHTGAHIIRMSRYAEVLAKAAGIEGGQRELILNTSPLHDIGKVALPDSILLKPGKLTPEERDLMKKHTIWGAEILGGSEFGFLKMAESIALTHHEKFDGTGYPNGLKGEDIPVVGRIVAIADVFDALTSRRPYKEAWSFEDSLAEIKKGSGSQFDPQLTEAFMGIENDVRSIFELNREQS